MPKATKTIKHNLGKTVDRGTAFGDVISPEDVAKYHITKGKSMMSKKLGGRYPKLKS